MAIRRNTLTPPLLPGRLLFTRKGDTPFALPLPPPPPPPLRSPCCRLGPMLPLSPALPQAAEVGPHNQRHGPCLVHFKGCTLTPDQLNAWLRDGPASCNVVSRSSPGRLEVPDMS